MAENPENSDIGPVGPVIDDMSEELMRPIFKNGCYHNEYDKKKFTSLLKFLFCEPDRSDIPKKKEVLDINLPILRPDFEKLKNPPESSVQAMWIGHASVLVQFDGITVLTDPIFSSRCAPFQWMGPKRYRDPPCTIKELPDVDVVIISHDHYDHLDHGSVLELHSRFGDSLRWYAPIGIGSWLKGYGVNNVVELSWWEEDRFTKKAKTFIFACVPAQHWCKRTAIDTNKRLWGSWAIKGPRHSFYFAGDTGYCKGFSQIGRKYGPFSLAAIPIGAYDPRWFMSSHHVEPKDSVQIHLDVRAEHSIGIHWGTFKLTYEPYMEPKSLLMKELEQRGMHKESFITINHGEVKTF
ncbi:hypothetical protein CHS0354_009011 [Potamilus streckersoni]|uniref:N-acetylphosphatidylethanolamine-hydrolyzing phospholipase D n=1 Tax=Potamilus streckersoni TaxID=2493646 RepID=A0AAE0THZ2_9BIVA|nr:hypothetical protein CHS0354_009011 [Potamilus streckersoni]